MKNKTTLLLMEQAILLVVFALAAAVCLRLFVWADGASKQDARQDHAVFQAQNAAEEVKAFRGNLEAAAQSYGGSVQGGIWRAELKEGYTLQVTPQKGEVSCLGRAKVEILGPDGSILAEIPVCWQEE